MLKKKKKKARKKKGKEKRKEKRKGYLEGQSRITLKKQEAFCFPFTTRIGSLNGSAKSLKTVLKKKRKKDKRKREKGKGNINKRERKEGMRECKKKEK